MAEPYLLETAEIQSIRFYEGVVDEIKSEFRNCGEIVISTHVNNPKNEDAAERMKQLSNELKFVKSIAKNYARQSGVRFQ